MKFEVVNLHLGCSKKFKGDRTWRSRSEREEKILVTTLKDLTVHGWKSDNCFRTGYLGKIEDAIKLQFRLTNMKTTSHINSKITVMKRNYNSLVSILGMSGVGFNDRGDYKIDCDNEEWDHIVKQDTIVRSYLSCDNSGDLLPNVNW
ncbi:hypothetical protein SASPL_105285 [Salvia splendens]|uniref:Myb/SANT-like domain-containing protein n=1 Tax=Salvia splendens TaxID=180675 RepID=A0A8X8YPC6_SALSN|nr:hypothetical protein SASPL_105285 [Salvia splendens]